MSLPAGTRLGSYQILALIGAGGMGEVYRARDPRLGRDVAIKVLPAAYATDADRLRRFEQEVRAAGSLNHPNIVVVHDAGSDGGSPYLVSELLEGDTLRARLIAGPLGVPKALDFALQIARGLQTAHDKGIIHRDLKPENLFVTTEGRIKILDFGLAKLMRPTSADAMAGASTVERTEPGVVMGTAGYMSPEQVRGEDVDHRTDIFAFGAILYEMLTGARAFSGASAMDVMSAILRADVPDAAETNPALPPALNRIVHHCLEKRAAARFQSAGDLSFALETLSASGGAPSLRVNLPSPPAGTRASRGLLGWVAAGLLAAVSLPLAITHFREPPMDRRAYRLPVLPPGKSTFGALAVSPDGRWLAFTNIAVGGKNELWIQPLEVQALNAAGAHSLPGTDGASDPFWAPDSQSVGFFANGQLKTIDIAGGNPRPLCEVRGNNRGGTWNRDGIIVFAANQNGPLYRISARSPGTPSAVTTLDATREERTHRWPHFLPDGQHFLYFVRSLQPQYVGAYLGSLDGQPAKRLPLKTSTDAIFAPPGLLLFVSDGTLMSQAFDPRDLEVTGEPSSLVTQVGYSLTLNRASFSASANGVLVYGGSEERRPVWFNRGGKPLDAVAPPHSYAHLWLSPDDTRVALERADPQTGADDILVIALDRGRIPTRFVSHPASDTKPIWTPGGHIVWASNRAGVYDLFRKADDGAGNDELLYESRESKYPTDGSPDNRYLLYETEDSKTKRSLWALPLSGPKTPFRLFNSEFFEGQARFSPDGRWIAYTTDKDGISEIYVVEASKILPAPGQPLPTARSGVSMGIRVSTEGGTQPQWRRDGKKAELFYLAPNRRLMAVSIQDGTDLPSMPQEVLETHVTDAGRNYQSYAVSRDGQRFLVLTPVEETTAATVLLNWASAVPRATR